MNAIVRKKVGGLSRGVLVVLDMAVLKTEIFSAVYNLDGTLLLHKNNKKDFVGFAQQKCCTIAKKPV